MNTKHISIPVKSHDDMILEVKGLIAIIYDSVMRLEDSYKSGNQADKHRHLKNFYQYKQFFIGQVENNNFTVCEKLRLYNLMYETCMQILHHQRNYYRLEPIIEKATHHYMTRLFTWINTILLEVEEIEHIQQVIKEKQELLGRMDKLRHHYELVLDGVNHTRAAITAQIDMLKSKLSAIDK